MKSASVKKQREDIDTKKIILDEAEILFAEKGYFGVSLSEIAKKVGIAKSSVLHHAGSKNELYRLIQERAFAQLKNLTLQSIRPESTEVENIILILHSYFRWIHENKVYYRLMIRAQLDNIGMNYRLTQSYIEPLYKLLEGFIHAGQKNGSILSITPRLFIFHLSTSIMSYFAFRNEFAHMSKMTEDQLNRAFLRELNTIIQRSLSKT